MSTKKRGGEGEKENKEKGNRMPVIEMEFLVRYGADHVMKSQYEMNARLKVVMRNRTDE